jgi:hypothetical protein
MLTNGRWDLIRRLTLNLLTTTIVAPPSNASKWQMGFSSAFKGLNPICHLMALLGVHPILHVSRIRVKLDIGPIRLTIN